ncbi:hypothetical protein KIH39_26390 [Telmatocola sphagniphila]|uniref:Uncharacterized protein n=1 Tax=Telmatocola sphagniphila TaxID=1123043 RepID=A0A8E6B6R9_9BACT|nr:hypothetical protein [Telmatocola sphagniphila]QVL32319.1 hypothetical protein KIH39_26390 [Telmatocola sphagniphila]
MSNNQQIEDASYTPVENRALATLPVANRAVLTREALDRATEERRLLGEYIASNMILEVDYGTVPGTNKRTLYKPGAEKLTQLFQCTPHYVLEDKKEDWTAPLFFYRYSCQLLNVHGVAVEEGVGCCSSWESKYRFRNESKKCPACGKATIIKSKAEYGGGWYCNKKRDGCGAKFGDDAPGIVDQKTGQVDNPEIYDQINTILKMAKKRALIDAAISLTRCSDLFTAGGGDDDQGGNNKGKKPAGAAAGGGLQDKDLVDTLAKTYRQAKTRADVLLVNKQVDENHDKLTPKGKEHLLGIAREVWKSLPEDPNASPATTPADQILANLKKLGLTWSQWAPTATQLLDRETLKALPAGWGLNHLKPADLDKLLQKTNQLAN